MQGEAAADGDSPMGHQKSSDLIGRSFFLLYRTFLRRGTPPKRRKISTTKRENFTVTPYKECGTYHTAFRIMNCKNTEQLKIICHPHR